jgi:methyl-accepting chemotaxis protein
MSFKNLSFKTKLLGSFILIIAIFSLSSAYSYYMIHYMTGLSDTATLRANDADKALEMKNYLAVLYGNQADLIINGNEKAVEHYQENTKKFNEILSYVSNQADTGEEKKWIAELRPASERYFSKFDEVKAIHDKRNTFSQEALRQQYSTVDDQANKIRSEADAIIDNIAQSYRQDADQAHRTYVEESRRIIFNTLLSATASAVIGIILALLLAGSIIKPVQIMLEGATAIAKGDLTRQIQVKSGDEIGKLAEAFRAMTGQMRDMVRQIVEKAATVSSSSQQLNSNAQQTSAAANETAATMGEIATTVEQVTANIQSVLGASEAAADHAQSGNGGIARIQEQMKTMVNSSMEASKSIDQLNNKSREINQIVDLINSIAEQTNLLALNAAIEAARAGEQGRGFAVVAEEVRELAEQSAAATKEIGGLVSAIQAESARAVENMSQGGKEVELGSRVVQEVSQSFGEIIRAVQALTAQIQDVAAATQQMSAGVENVAASTEEQTAAMEEVSASAESLTGLAVELNLLVSKFKV